MQKDLMDYKIRNQEKYFSTLALRVKWVLVFKDFFFF